MGDAKDPAVSSVTDEVVELNYPEGPLGLERTDGWADTASKTAVRGGESSKSLELASTALKELYEIHDTFFSSDKGEKKVRENESHLLLERTNDIELEILHASQHQMDIGYLCRHDKRRFLFYSNSLVFRQNAAIWRKLSTHHSFTTTV